MRNTTVIEVAFADDHALVRQGIVEIIGRAGDIKVCVEAANGEELMQQLRKAKRLPDICIVDIQMPVMNGFETVIAIKKQWPHMGVLVLTVFDNEFQVLRMIQHGANGYLTKDCVPESLRNAIISINETGFYYADLSQKRMFLSVKNNEVKPPHLTERELMLLQHICSDLSYAQIAAKLITTTRSVEGYRDSLFRKFNVNSRVSLALLTSQLGIV